jgi:hypothetical protein
MNANLVLFVAGRLVALAAAGRSALFACNVAPTVHASDYHPCSGLTVVCEGGHG